MLHLVATRNAGAKCPFKALRSVLLGVCAGPHGDPSCNSPRDRHAIFHSSRARGPQAAHPFLTDTHFLSTAATPAGARWHLTVVLLPFCNGTHRRSDRSSVLSCFTVASCLLWPLAGLVIVPVAHVPRRLRAWRLLLRCQPWPRWVVRCPGALSWGVTFAGAAPSSGAWLPRSGGRSSGEGWLSSF